MKNSNNAAGSLQLIAARKQFYDLIDRFSAIEKAAYEEALSKCPHLVKFESNPDFYLESSSYDAFSAVRRVLEYWTLRKLWFQERAFLPMNITEEGALTKEDIEVLSTGFMMLLPEDKHGRAVAFHDRARLTNPDLMDVTKRKRCIFYVLSVAGESESCRKNGLVFLSAFCDKTRKSTFDLQMLGDKVALMKKEVLPYHFVGLHIVMLSQRPILNMVVPMTLQAFEKMNCLKRGIVVHSRKPPLQLLEDFKHHGFDPESIPKVPFGGFWTLGCFRRWMEDRLFKEKKMLGQQHSMSSIASVEIESADGVPCGPGSGASNDEENYRELLRKKRKMGAAYARRKRARNKIEVEVMQSEVDRLMSQKASFAADGVMLENLLAQAKDVMARIESGAESFLESSVPPLSMALHPVQQVYNVPYMSNHPNGLPFELQSQGDLDIFRHIMASLVQNDVPNPYLTNVPYQSLQQQQLTASTQQLLLSLLAGYTGMNNGNTISFGSVTGEALAAQGVPGLLQTPTQQQYYPNNHEGNYSGGVCNGMYSAP